MCGIAGFTAVNRDREATIKSLTDAIVHRGPDAYGSWLDGESGMTLGHRRLSIIDLTESGAQPMVSASGRFVICYNGEIYGANLIKESLYKEGLSVTFKGSSDTEILLEAIEFWGLEKTLAAIKGMFAFAVFDRKDKSLYLARDRVGEKPLYYALIDGHLVFGSEIGVIKAFPGFKKEINQDVLPMFLTRGYIAAPDTIYKEVYKLPAGSILKIENVLHEPITKNDLKINYYWNLKERARELENTFTGSYDEAVTLLKELLTDSVEKQMVADVPVGAYLSGGIDSATIVALMTSINPGKVKTFTIGFDEEKYDESVFARDIAKHLNTDHTELIVSEKELKDTIPLISDIYGEPFGDSSQIPTYLVSKLARSKVTVSLSGDAGDELFCGYRTYDKVYPFWKKMKGLPSIIRKAGSFSLLALSNASNTAYRAGKCLATTNIVELKNSLAFTSKKLDSLTNNHYKALGEKLLADDFNSMMLDDLLLYHPDDILVKVDRAGMKVSLENRIPMLDRDVVELALSLPLDYKYDGVVQKKILKDLLYQYIPKELMDRPKKGFAVPLARWLKEGETAEWAAESMTNMTFAKDGYLNSQAVNSLWSDFLKGKEDPDIVWNLLMLEQWYRNN